MRIRMSMIQWWLKLLGVVVLNINVTLLVNRMYSQYEQQKSSDSEMKEGTRRTPVAVERLKIRHPWEIVNFIDDSDDVDVPNVDGDLPSFADDFSEYALGSIIERVSDSFDLFTTVFFLGHHVPQNEFASPDYNSTRGAASVQLWKKALLNFKNTTYFPNGIRETPSKIYCKISHTIDGPSYVVEGQFVPRNPTLTFLGDITLDIFRCKMLDTEAAYMNLARSPEILHVEIIRDDISVLKFGVPWHSRKAGFMLTEPSGRNISRFDAWKGFNKDTPGVWTHDRVYLITPGWHYEPTKITLPPLLEFIQHHVLQGVDHIFTTSVFKWDSRYSTVLERVLNTFIDDGHISLNTYAGSGMDGLYLMGGGFWGNMNFQSYHLNLYSYLSKGVADYVAVWDFKDFFIPKGKHKNLRELLAAVESPYGPAPKFSAVAIDSKTVAGMRGMADNDPHPFCYLLLRSEKTQINKPELYSRALQNQMNEVIRPDPWLGQQFTYGPERQSRRKGFENSIRPTRTIYHGSLYQAGACQLPQGWNGCEKDNDYCIRNSTLVPADTDSRGTQYFDDSVTARDAKAIDRERDGVLSHLSYDERLSASTQHEGKVRGVYANTYFPLAYAALEKRGLVMPMELPEIEEVVQFKADLGWLLYPDLLSSIEGAVKGGLKGTKPCLDLANDMDEESRIYLSDILPSPYDSAHDAHVEASALPAFARDNSEVFLAGVMERKADSWDLHVTTFMMCHALLVPDTAPGVEKNMKALKVRHDKDTLLKWSRTIHAFKNITYLESGVRAESPRYFCRMRTTAKHEPYIVQGHFVPNRVISFPGPYTNERLDILRCKVEDSQLAYMRYAGSADEMSVEILREEEILIKYVLPWNTRVQSKFLNAPAVKETSKSPLATTIDPWKGFDKNAPGVWKRDKLFLCTPGVDSMPNRKYLPVLLEFIQHHLNIGVTHIFLTMPFPWHGAVMTQYARILKSYIDEGSVSLTSHLDDSNLQLYSVMGMTLQRDNIKTFQTNFFNYYTKGMADFMGIWDSDEFFIPKGENKNLIDVIEGAYLPPGEEIDHEIVSSYTEDTNIDWQGGRGWADGSGHPPCFILLYSDVIAPYRQFEGVNVNHLWIGERFSHSPEPRDTQLYYQWSNMKAIVPTKTIFQTGLHMAGACTLDYPYGGCKKDFEGLCFQPKGLKTRANMIRKKFHGNHYFDEKVMPWDAKNIDVSNKGSLFHFMLNHMQLIHSNRTDVSVSNDYKEKYFPDVLASLRKRQLDLLIDIPGYFNPDGLDDRYSQANKNNRNEASKSETAITGT